MERCRITELHRPSNHYHLMAQPYAWQLDRAKLLCVSTPERTWSQLPRQFAVSANYRGQAH